MRTGERCSKHLCMISCNILGLLRFFRMLRNMRQRDQTFDCNNLSLPTHADTMNRPVIITRSQSKLNQLKKVSFDTR